MHLQRTVSAAQRDTPIAIADNLNFLVSSCFDIQLNQNILVVTDAGCLDLIEDFPDQLGRFFSLTQRNDPLSFTAAAANGLKTNTILRILLAHLNDSFGQRFTQFIDGV